MANTKQRAVRIADEIWAAAGERAALEHRTVSDIVRIALRAYAENRYHAVEPKVRRTS